MPTFIALLRGINVGGHKKLAMSDLRSICESLGYTGVRTLLNSGNAIFEAKSAAEAKRLQEKVEAKIILRTPKEMAEVIARNPWKREGSRLMVTFLDGAPKGGFDWSGPEETHLDGRHLYLYYPDGMGQSKLTNAAIEKALGVAGTTRNWNTVLKLAALTHPKG
jgi:uncharacterized protein (DUF1697 family)